MYLPSIFDDRMTDSLFDNFFGKPLAPMNRLANTMKTDIVEKDGEYAMSIEMPGFKKEDITAELKEGYLTISAGNNETKEEKDDKGNVVYSERHTGELRRSYFVGKHLTEEDIKAHFEDGILKIKFPTEEKKPAVEEKKLISIA